MLCGVAGAMEKGQLAVQRETHLGCWTGARHRCLGEKLAVKVPPVDAHVPKCQALKSITTTDMGMGLLGLKCLRGVWTGHTRVSYFWLSGPMMPQVSSVLWADKRLPRRGKDLSVLEHFMWEQSLDGSKF